MSLKVTIPGLRGVTVALALILAVFSTYALCKPLASSAAGPEVLQYQYRAQNQPLGALRTSLALTSELEPIDLEFTRAGGVALNRLPEFNSQFSGRFAGVGGAGQVVLYTLDPTLQSLVQRLVKEAKAPHIAVVAIEPETGRILAMDGRSSSVADPVFHTGFPAASLFKVVTTAAALENTAMGPDSLVRYRGGTYTLERWNYLPDAKRDRRFMSITDALARSCNPVFGRIANSLNPTLLRQYARSFGFNAPISFERSVPLSSANIPSDSYELSRTAAGFGEVTISPIHAATLMAGVAHHGVMQRPTIIDKVFSQNGQLLYQSKPESISRMIKPETAQSLMEMMVSTTTLGTTKKDFMVRNSPVLGSVEVAAKTGTLSGDNPKGLNHWFIAAAPKADPRIALSVVVVDPRSSSARASRIGKAVIEQYLGLEPTTSLVKSQNAKSIPTRYRAPNITARSLPRQPAKLTQKKTRSSSNRSPQKTKKK